MERLKDVNLENKTDEMENIKENFNQKAEIKSMKKNLKQKTEEIKNVKENLKQKTEEIKSVKENLKQKTEEIKNVNTEKLNNSIIPYNLVLSVLCIMIIGLLTGDAVKAVLFGVLYGMVFNVFIDFVKNMD